MNLKFLNILASSCLAVGTAVESHFGFGFIVFGFYWAMVAIITAAATR